MYPGGTVRTLLLLFGKLPAIACLDTPPHVRSYLCMNVVQNSMNIYSTYHTW